MPLLTSTLTEAGRRICQPGKGDLEGHEQCLPQGETKLCLSSWSTETQGLSVGFSVLP